LAESLDEPLSTATCIKSGFSGVNKAENSLCGLSYCIFSHVAANNEWRARLKSGDLIDLELALVINKLLPNSNPLTFVPLLFDPSEYI
jgi:hypothetical protein